jgi:uncharacterized protein
MIFATDGTPVATHLRADLCGAATSGGSFTVTDGSGAVWSADDQGLTPLATDETQWDNHLVALT